MPERERGRLAVQNVSVGIGTALLSMAWAVAANTYAAQPFGPAGAGRSLWALGLCWASTVALFMLMRRSPRTTFMAALAAASLIAVATTLIYGLLTGIVLLGAEDARNALELIVSLGAGGVGPLVIVVGLLLLRARKRRMGFILALLLTLTPFWFALLRSLDVHEFH